MALGGALGPDLSPVTPRLFAWQPVVLGDIHLRFTVAGVAQTHIHPSSCVAGVALMALGGALGPDLSPADAAALCVAGVVHGDIHVYFTWQAWHKFTSTVVLRGRRGTIFDTPSFTHHFVTHHLSHTTLSHTIFHHTLFHTPLCHHAIFHTQLCHTLSLTHHLSHTTLSHTIFDTPSFTHHLCNTPSFTHHLSPHHPSHTTLSHTIFHHTIFHT